MAINSATTVGFPNNTTGTMRLADPADVVDGVFIILDTAGTKWERIVDGPYRAMWAKIFNNGTNSLSSLQAVFNHSRVQEVVVDFPDGGAMTLSGTLTIPAGK